MEEIEVKTIEELIEDGNIIFEENIANDETIEFNEEYFTEVLYNLENINNKISNLDTVIITLMVGLGLIFGAVLTIILTIFLKD